MAKKKTTKKAAAKSKRGRAAKTKPAAKRKAARSSAAKTAPPPADGSASIGRVLVSQEERLYMLFREDYHARQIFEFLRAETVKDLEQFSPQQIVKLLSQPIQRTVERIREKLAEKNRHLAGDEAFVVQFKRRGAGA